MEIFRYGKTLENLENLYSKREMAVKDVLRINDNLANSN